MGPLLHSLPSLPFPNRKKSQIACKRETKLLPRDVLTQHLICKVGPLPLDLRKCTTTTKKESKPSPLKLLSFFLKQLPGLLLSLYSFRLWGIVKNMEEEGIK